MYSKKVYARAIEQKLNETKKKKAICAARKEEALSASQELFNISLELKKNGATVAGLALSGDAEGIKALEKRNNELIKKKEKIEKEIGIDEYIPDCKLCNDTGYIDKKVCPCVQKIAKEIAYSDLCEISPLKDCSFDNFSLDYYSDDGGDTSPRKHMKSVFDFCREYADNLPDAGNMLLLGGTGLGKTHLSLSVAEKAINDGMWVIYGTAQNLFNQMSKEHFSYSYDSDELMNDTLNCDLLIIDDLGTEFSTQFTLSCVYNIINTRCNCQRPTIINTNFSLAELEKIYSPRVLSRIIGNYKMKKFVGADIRQIKVLNNR